MTVDDQQLICLDIMSRGEDMLAHGSWEAPIKRLAMRGLCRKIGSGYRISDQGRALFAESEGKTVAEIEAMAPPMPEWIATPVTDVGLVVLRRNDVSVSGYDNVTARYAPVVHGQQQSAVLVPHDRVDSFLQAMLDAAWARGLRPSAG